MCLLETRSKYPSTKQPTAGTRKKCSVSSIRVLAKSCGFKLQNLQSVMENPPLTRLYPKKREKGSIVKRRKIWYNEKTWEAKEAMPSFDIHLAIARNYMKNHKEITNVQDFIKGSIAPDLVPDKRISHYTKEQDKNDLAKSLHNKVAIDEFLKKNEIKKCNSKFLAYTIFSLTSSLMMYKKQTKKDYSIAELYKECETTIFEQI